VDEIDYYGLSSTFRAIFVDEIRCFGISSTFRALFVDENLRDNMDLPAQIKTGGSVSAKYSYIADGMKLSATSPSSRCLYYYGDFGLPYTDFGARQYSHSLHRWLVPDPMNEKYYDISPNAYCAGDPVNLIDPDGRKLFIGDYEYRDGQLDVTGSFVGGIGAQMLHNGQIIKPSWYD